MNIFNTPTDFLDFSVNNYPSRNIKKNFEAYFYNYFINNNFDSQYT